MPEGATVGKPFDVGITVTNPAKRALNVKVSLAFPPMGEQYLGMTDEALKIDEKDGVTIDLAKGETRHLDLHVTALLAGVLGIQAHVECERQEGDDEDEKQQKRFEADYDKCQEQLRSGMAIGTFDAIEIGPLQQEQPKTVAVTWP